MLRFVVLASLCVTSMAQAAAEQAAAEPAVVEAKADEDQTPIAAADKNLELKAVLGKAADEQAAAEPALVKAKSDEHQMPIAAADKNLEEKAVLGKAFIAGSRVRVVVPFTTDDSVHKGCVDISNGADDSFDPPCSGYVGYPEDCGGYDDTDFSSNVMCCACGGGGPQADVNCVEEVPTDKTACTVQCGKIPYKVTTPATGSGAACDQEYQCLAGEGACPAEPCTTGANGKDCGHGTVTGTTGTCGCKCHPGFDGDNCETAKVFARHRGEYCTVINTVVPHTASDADVEQVRNDCEEFCKITDGCAGCSVSLVWNAIPTCDKIVTWSGKIMGDVSLKPTGSTSSNLDIIMTVDAQEHERALVERDAALKSHGEALKKLGDTESELVALKAAKEATSRHEFAPAVALAAQEHEPPSIVVAAVAGFAGAAVALLSLGLFMKFSRLAIEAKGSRPPTRVPLINDDE